MPRILYIGSFEKLWDEEGMARGLEANGAEVLRMHEHSFSFNLYIEHLKQGYDYVFFAKLKIHPNRRHDTVYAAKQYGAKSVCLMPDLYWGLTRQLRIPHDAMFKADIVMSPDGAERDWPCKHVCIRQSIPDEVCYIGQKDDRFTSDVAFVGSLNGEYPYRTQLIQNLEKQYGNRFRWYGRENSDEVRGIKLNRLCASAKVMIGESVYSPYYWSNRIYETLGRGGFMVHPMIEGLEKDYEPYKHFIPYKHGDFQSLYDIIDYYIEHPEERKKIGKAAMKHTKKYHTCSVRAKHILDVLRTTYND